jgi:hypothetical protein
VYPQLEDNSLLCEDFLLYREIYRNLSHRYEFALALPLDVLHVALP